MQNISSPSATGAATPLPTGTLFWSPKGNLCTVLSLDVAASTGSRNRYFVKRVSYTNSLPVSQTHTASWQIVLKREEVEVVATEDAAADDEVIAREEAAEEEAACSPPPAQEGVCWAKAVGTRASPPAEEDLELWDRLVSKD